MSEATLFEHVRAHLKAFGYLFYHTYDSRRSNDGFPDIVAIKEKRLLAIELKSEKGQVTQEQRAWLLAFWMAGDEMHIWRPRDLSSGLIEQVLRGEI